MLTRRNFLTAIGVSSLFNVARAKVGDIKIEVCSRDVGGAIKYGFDYIEPQAAEIATMREKEFPKYTDQVLASPIRCEVYSPCGFESCGEGDSTSALTDDMEIYLARCRKLGASIVVGKCRSRKVPEGFSRERAQQQIAAFLRMAGDIARQHRIMITVEPLGRQESNTRGLRLWRWFVLSTIPMCA